MNIGASGTGVLAFFPGLGIGGTGAQDIRAEFGNRNLWVEIRTCCKFGLKRES